VPASFCSERVGMCFQRLCASNHSLSAFRGGLWSRNRYAPFVLNFVLNKG
jgi:hypothetical protein